MIGEPRKFQISQFFCRSKSISEIVQGHTELKMAKLKIIDTRWLPFFSYFANKWDKTCGGNAHRCTLPVCTCIASNTHTFPQRVNVQHQPHTPIVQIASFSPAASPPPRSVNRVQSIRVISCAEWTSCLTGCGLRGSWAQETRWAEAETSTPPQPSPSCQEISTCLLNTELYVSVSCTPRRLSAIRKYLDVSSR